MRTLLKIIGTIIGIVIILFIAIAVIVPVYFHPNDYKEEIAAFVEEKTGRELKIQGDIALSVFPWLAVELGALELGNAPGFPDSEFARLERMEVGVKLLPLLKKRLEMRAVKVHGLELNLIRDKDGRTNWSDLAALRAAKKSSKDSGPEDEDHERTKDDAEEFDIPLAVLGVGGLDIQNAALRWSDAQKGEYYRLEKLVLETGAITPDFPAGGSIALQGPLDIKASFDLEGNKPRLSGHVDTSTKLTADFAKRTFHLANLHITGKLTGKSLPNGRLDLDIDANVDADLIKQSLRAKNLMLSSGQLKANGAIAVTRLLDKPEFHGTLQLEKFNPRALLTELGQQIPETADPKAMTSASLSATIQGGADHMRLKPLAIRLDETTLKGALDIHDFSTVGIRFDLAADTIDADRYLPPTESGQAQGAQPGSTTPTSVVTPGVAASGAARLPLDMLRALDIQGKAKIGKLTIANLNFTDLALDLKAKDGVIRAHPVKMNLYQGNYSGNIGINARGRAIRVSLDEKLAGVRAAPLLRDLRQDDVLSGKLQLALRIDANGTTPEELKENITGNLDFKFENGMIKGIDVVHTICDIAKATRNADNLGEALGMVVESLGAGVDTGADKGRSETEFQELVGRLPVTKGRISINDTLALKAPLLRVNGKGGAIDIGKGRLDNVAFIVESFSTCKGQGGKTLGELKGMEIPITCNGPMEIQSCLNAETLAKTVIDVIGERLKKKAEKEVKKVILDKLGGELGDGLGEKLGDELGDKIDGDVGKALEHGIKNLLGP
uniref:AsmA protein n=1 Tax=Candidatus Kentrum sp. SD TaxID=2126332 RepID=A0A450YLX7_9GAMM|nr:MAG: AsmA protein [Candidatus Kentron sp. SD]VFK48592.1 MAG: AsmA protein [Candidatus Kentron sp. SD]VFK80601.1 MAG: AsmA protein [Candidatus Kentron sp. SD]